MGQVHQGRSEAHDGALCDRGTTVRRLTRRAYGGMMEIVKKNTNYAS
jgi:hypothetical protein